MNLKFFMSVKQILFLLLFQTIQEVKESEPEKMAFHYTLLLELFKKLKCNQHIQKIVPVIRRQLIFTNWIHLFKEHTGGEHYQLPETPWCLVTFLLPFEIMYRSVIKILTVHGIPKKSVSLVILGALESLHLRLY